MTEGTLEQRCPDCGRPFATRDGEEWLSSDPTNDSNYALCGVRVWPGGDDHALIDCQRETIARLRAGSEPAPTGEATREHREAATAAVPPGRHHPTLERVAQLLATREQAAYQRGRESAQGGWIAPPELEGVAGYLRAELRQFGSARSYRVERALALLEPLLPPPSKGGER